MIDDRTRLAHALVMPNETSDSCIAAFEQSAAWFAKNGIRIERAMTDNGTAYKKRWREELQRLGIETRYTRPYRPQTNGKAERLIQTLLREMGLRRRLQRQRRAMRGVASIPRPLQHPPLPYELQKHPLATRGLRPRPRQQRAWALHLGGSGVGLA
ncbi:MAG: sle [Thermoleophilia bacterium]|nr:sle [Thermoleophilia bacterium]